MSYEVAYRLGTVGDVALLNSFAREPQPYTYYERLSETRDAADVDMGVKFALSLYVLEWAGEYARTPPGFAEAYKSLAVNFDLWRKVIQTYPDGRVVWTGYEYVARFRTGPAASRWLEVEYGAIVDTEEA